MLLMGKSTISTGPFSIAMFVYRRVPPNHPLVGGLEHDLIFPYIGNVITPTDELLFFIGVGLNHQPDLFYQDFSMKETIQR